MGSSLLCGLSLLAVHGLLVAVASLFCRAQALQIPGLQYLQHTDSGVAAPRLWSTGSVVVLHGFSCSSAFGILPDQ